MPETITISAEPWVLEAAIHALSSASRKFPTERERDLAFRAGCDLQIAYTNSRWPKR